MARIRNNYKNKEFYSNKPMTKKDLEQAYQKQYGKAAAKEAEKKKK